jgi:hypothetical protein
MYLISRPVFSDAAAEVSGGGSLGVSEESEGAAAGSADSTDSTDSTLGGFAGSAVVRAAATAGVADGGAAAASGATGSDRAPPQAKAVQARRKLTERASNRDERTIREL